MTQKNRIIKAKIFLSKSSMLPFFAYLLYQLEVVEDKNCPTIGTDGERLFINYKFIKTLSDSQLMFALAHEALHSALNHIGRKGDRNHMLYNFACDYVINAELKQYPQLEISSDWLYDEKYKGWYSEQVYADLFKNAKKIKINCGSSFDKNSKGKPCRGDHRKWGNQSKDKQKKLESKWKRALNKAGEIQKQHGELSEGMERLVDSIAPRVNWKEVLMSYVAICANDYSYSRPDRRFLNSEFIMPSMSEGSVIENVVIALDTSGSIDQETLSKFVSDVKNLLSSFDNVKIIVCCIDTSVYGWQEIDKFELMDDPKGGGGTNYGVIFEEIKKRSIDPSVLVVMGDGFADYPSQGPDYDTIFLFTRNHQKPPFGRLIIYEN